MCAPWSYRPSGDGATVLEVDGVSNCFQLCLKTPLWRRGYCYFYLDGELKRRFSNATCALQPIYDRIEPLVCTDELLRVRASNTRWRLLEWQCALREILYSPPDARALEAALGEARLAPLRKAVARTRTAPPELLARMTRLAAAWAAAHKDVLCGAGV